MGERGQSLKVWKYALGGVALLASLSSWWWIDYTPLRGAMGVVLCVIGVAWAVFAFVRRHRRIAAGLLAITALYAIVGFVAGASTGPFTDVEFTAAPINLEHLADMSFFRSCAGHDFSGPSADDVSAEESDRNMKHYLGLDVTYADAGEIAVMAMTDGVITRATTAASAQELANSQFTVMGDFASEVDLTASTFTPLGRWTLRYQHVVPTVEEGEHVSAGEIIGYVPPADWSTVQFKDDATSYDIGSDYVSFGLALVWISYMPGAGEHLDSFMTHLSPQLAAQFSDAGFDPDRAVISRAERDAAPCNGEYDVSPAADYFHGDELRSGSGVGGGGRPDCTADNIGETFVDDEGTWLCQTADDGRIVWGPAT